MQAVAHGNRHANGDTRFKLSQGQPAQGFQRNKRHGNRRGCKAQPYKEKRIAHRDRVLNGKKGSAPEHGDQNQDRFLRLNGEGKTGNGHGTPARRINPVVCDAFDDSSM